MGARADMDTGGATNLPLETVTNQGVGIANSPTQNVLKRLIKYHNVHVLAITEPLTNPNPERFSRALGLAFKRSNSNGKIWIFVEEGANFVVEDDSDQVLHGRFSSPRLASHILVSTVYANCTRTERQHLSDKLRVIPAISEGTPWIVGGDFNTILSPQERVGSNTNRQAEMIDFAEAIEDCRLLDPGFDGLAYTWAKNGLLERLDRVLVSEAWPQIFEATRVTNLPRIASDYGPVLARGCGTQRYTRGKALRFQNMWIRHEGFLDLVREAWTQTTEAVGLLNLQLKLARTKKILKQWNKEVFGNIHSNLREMEDNVVAAQCEFEANPSPANRALVNKHIAQYILLLKMEEDYWRQKATRTRDSTRAGSNRRGYGYAYIRSR
ncbi:uncharacterized protein LOC121781454 [Salvia splendens]|uniref:uncharacterized protein LOC121781454 n=1 Tax=Salvia splendens TaxID=180675 RepID=UPI001C280488|nr:uncharacterized protein LOC121781454 [Salvia splendens]